MRKSILHSVFAGTAWTLTLAACDRGGPPGHTIVDAVPHGATQVACERVRITGDPAPTEIRLATDSTWTILDASRGEILELDDRLEVRDRTPIPAAGPGSAAHPVSVAPVGDSAWAVAARGGLRLVVLSRSGRELDTVPLDFIPHSLESVGPDEFLLTAMPFGTKPPTVAVRLAGGRARPVDVPRRVYADMTVNALGNTALVETVSDGSALVVHQFMAPRAFRVAPGGEVVPLPMPTPAGTRDAIEFVPRSPLTDDQMPHTLVPAMAMSVDGPGGEVYVLTRSGRERDGRPERVVLRLTEDLRFLDGFLLDVAAAGLVYLPRPGIAVVHDDEDRFFACPIPDRAGPDPA